MGQQAADAQVVMDGESDAMAGFRLRGDS